MGCRLWAASMLWLLSASPARADEPAAGAPHAWPRGRSFTLRIHLDSAAPGTELWRSGRRDEKICLAPCDRVVEILPEDEYYFTAAGAPDSTLFHFQPRDGAVDLAVRPGSSNARTAGVVALVLGAITTSVGSAIDFNESQTKGIGVHGGPGVVVEAVGLVLSISGALAILLNGTSWSVTRRVDAPPPAGGWGSVLPKVRLDFDPLRQQVLLAGRF